MRHPRLSPTAALAALVIGLLACPAAAGAAAATAPVTPSPFSILNQFASEAPSTSLDQLLRELATYDGGIDSAAWWKVRDHVYSRKDDEAARAECEAKLLRFLASKATPAARLAVSRLLRVIAGESAIPALQAMLADGRSADLALYVLQPMPGAAADKALLEALAATKSATRIAVIAAVGERRVADGVRALVPLLSQPEFARPSALALGAIGNDAAARALVGALGPAAPPLKPVIGAAILKCAERALAAGDAAAASALYQGLWTDKTLAESLRAAAAIGRISAAGTGGSQVVQELLGGSDPLMHQVAIGRVRDVVPAEGVAALCAMLPRLPEASQVALLAALSGYPRERVLPSILEAASSDAAPVKIAALRALQAAGDASVVPLLLETASKARGPEQAAARAALAGLKGRAVDEALAAGLAQELAEELEIEVLVAVAERRIYPARPAVVASLASGSPKARVQALKSLRAIGTPSDIPAVLDLLVECGEDGERSEAEATVSALAQKVSRADARGREVRARLVAEKDSGARGRLIGLLPLIGDGSTLPLLRAALGEDDPEIRDAAVRAITAWPTSAARDDLFRLARDARNETHRLLAIRGFIRSIGLDRYRDPRAAVADLRLAAGFAWRPEEQKLVLGALGQFACTDALDLARGFLAEPEVKAEARAAVERIERALKSGSRQ